MTAWICVTCGVQYADTDRAPRQCIICRDDRQYVPLTGQSWTTIGRLSDAGHSCVLTEVEPGLHSLAVEPKVGIGQRSLLVSGASGCVLWDPPGFLDDAGLAAVRRLGGLAAVSASHPHMYGAMVEWSRAFDGVPIYLPSADRDWVTRPDAAIRFWGGRCGVSPGMTLVQCGGHFPGSAVLHWAGGAAGRGAVLAGDTVMVAQDRRWVSFMRSYPNYLPLSAAAVHAIADRLSPYEFDRLYDNFGRVLDGDARTAVTRSAERYSRWISGEMDHLT